MKYLMTLEEIRQGLQVGYYEGAIIATVVCLVTLISLKGISDLINDRISKSYIMVFASDTFDEDSFLDFVSKEGV